MVWASCQIRKIAGNYEWTLWPTYSAVWHLSQCYQTVLLYILDIQRSLPRINITKSSRDIVQSWKTDFGYMFCVSNSSVVRWAVALSAPKGGSTVFLDSFAYSSGVLGSFLPMHAHTNRVLGPAMTWGIIISEFCWILESIWDSSRGS